MLKDYQEVERIVEDLRYEIRTQCSCRACENNNANIGKDCVIRQALATYGNARVEEVIKIAENMREEIPLVSPPDSEAYMYSLAQFNRVAGKNKTIVDLIKTIKK